MNSITLFIFLAKFIPFSQILVLGVFDIDIFSLYLYVFVFILKILVNLQWFFFLSDMSNAPCGVLFSHILGFFILFNPRLQGYTEL